MCAPGPARAEEAAQWPWGEAQAQPRGNSAAPHSQTRCLPHSILNILDQYKSQVNEYDRQALSVFQS